MRTHRWLIGLLFAAATYAALYFSMGSRHHGCCGRGHCDWHDENAGTDRHTGAAAPWDEGDERVN